MKSLILKGNKRNGQRPGYLPFKPNDKVQALEITELEISVAVGCGPKKLKKKKKKKKRRRRGKKEISE